jgi:hypothetical protein
MLVHLGARKGHPLSAQFAFETFQALCTYMDADEYLRTIQARGVLLIVWPPVTPRFDRTDAQGLVVVIETC